jgi:hypothetical protein
MTETLGRHEVRPAFKAELGHEIARALRQEARHAAERRSPRWYRLPALRLAAALLIGLVAGAAPAQVQESQQRRQLLQAAEAEAQLAMIRLSLVATEAEETRRQVEAGLLGREVVLEAQARLRSAQVRHEIAALNVAEIQASARGPRDDLAAPRVGARDFVRERLLLTVSDAELSGAVAQQALALTARRFQVGTVSQFELLAAQAEAERARTTLELLASRVALREQFIREGLVPAEVERRAQLVEVQSRLKEAQLMLGLAEQRLATVARSEAVGVASRPELLRAELEKVEWELQVQRLMRELQELEQFPRPRG